MKMKLIPLFVLAIFVCQNTANAATYDVTSYGAKGDGETNDSPAFERAWKDACQGSNSGHSNGGDSSSVLLIPTGGNFLLNPTSFEGPCNSGSVTVQVEGRVIASTDRNAAGEKYCQRWLTFKDINNLVMEGSGTFDGQGQHWWGQYLLSELRDEEEEQGMGLEDYTEEHEKKHDDYEEEHEKKQKKKHKDYEEEPEKKHKKKHDDYEEEPEKKNKKHSDYQEELENKLKKKHGDYEEEPDKKYTKKHSIYEDEPDKKFEKKHSDYEEKSIKKKHSGDHDEGKSCNGEHPTNLAFFSCKNLRINKISSKNSGRNHMSISQCDDVVISDVTLEAPHNSPNTDGIDISHSSVITIKDSDIRTGDDCVAVNSETYHINITNVNCGPGHGISIGSFNKKIANVEDMYVRGCTFKDTSNGARIKTYADGMGGYVKSVTFEDITLENVKYPIIIDQYYQNHPHKLTSYHGNGYDINEGGGGVKISDVKFIGFKGSCSGEEAITLKCGGSGCTGITLRDVNIMGSEGHSVKSVVQNVHQSTAESTSPKVSFSSTGGSEDNEVNEYYEMEV